MWGFKNKHKLNYRPNVLKWQVLILVLRIILALLDYRIVIVLVGLYASPYSPYVRVLDETIEQGCIYVGGRGIWQPGWSSHCPTLTFRQHFYI